MNEHFDMRLADFLKQSMEKVKLEIMEKTVPMALSYLKELVL